MKLFALLSIGYTASLGLPSHEHSISITHGTEPESIGPRFKLRPGSEKQCSECFEKELEEFRKLLKETSTLEQTDFIPPSIDEPPYCCALPHLDYIARSLPMVVVLGSSVDKVWHTCCHNEARL